MVKTAMDKDGQRHNGNPVRACNIIGCRRKRANVELQVTNHSPKSGNLRLDREHLGFNPLDGNRTVANLGEVGCFRDCESQFDFFRQSYILLFPNIASDNYIPATTPLYCFRTTFCCLGYCAIYDLST
jgi:hypothetical protein